MTVICDAMGCGNWATDNVHLRIPRGWAWFKVCEIHRAAYPNGSSVAVTIRGPKRGMAASNADSATEERNA